MIRSGNLIFGRGGGGGGNFGFFMWSLIRHLGLGEQERRGERVKGLGQEVEGRQLYCLRINRYWVRIQLSEFVVMSITIYVTVQ